MGRFADWLRKQGIQATTATVTGLAASAGTAFAAKNGGRKKDSDADKDSNEGRQRNAESEGSHNRNSDDSGSGSRQRNDDGDNLSRQDRRREYETTQRADDTSETDDDTAERVRPARDRSTDSTVDQTQDAAEPAPATSTNGIASIQTPEGDVLVGYDPVSQSMIARSGNVTASVGPDGPLVIIADEEVVQVNPGTSPGTPPAEPLPPPRPADPSGGEPDDTGFQS